jgi:NADH:ubiquinone oxidoreductase subunit E
MDLDKAALAAHVQELLSDIPRERQQLLPALWRVFEEYWHLSPELIDLIAQALEIPYAEVYGVASFYALFDNPDGKRPIYVCTDVMCALYGAEDLFKAGEDLAKAAMVRIKEAPCLGHCDGAPAVFDGQQTIRQANTKLLAEAIRGGNDA